MARSIYRELLAVLLVVSLGSGCSDDEGNGEKDKGPDAPVTDAPQCNAPPDITACHRPPNGFSQTLWFCEGCGYCGGGPATKACNGFNGDCREFYDSCIPKTYTRCDQNAPDAILGICGDCFFRETGAIPSHCDKLIDAGLAGDTGSTGDK